MGRFSVTYWLGAADEPEARTRALDIALEQTVEIPRDTVPAGYVEDEILGRLEKIEPAGTERGGFLAEISYSDDDMGGDFLQLLNIVFGNSSIKANIRVEDIRLSEGILSLCAGPRFGLPGLRERTGVDNGPILMSAIKPVGLSASELGRLAHDFALGGMDLVKDDHGLVDQRTAPFSDRLKACVDGVNEANARTGGRAAYVPNITGPAMQIFDRAWMAKEQGAGGVMVAPALAGYDVTRALAADPEFGLPIVSHPTFSGANMITPTTGFSHRFYFGLLQRLMGVDAVVYPNFGGRFGFTLKECQSIVEGCQMEFGGYKPIVPAPGGGMTFERVPEMRAAYGDRVMYLVGGALIREKANLVEASKRLVAAVRGDA
ncbi:RuBisCO large subunit C-terminal-like domain-containing protein [Rhizobium sp. Root482]|uniref:RuBisCO large subunit C-terminal-like domain-containing protein n=1 Tax=Rhizobium sp. Root482 TaxID=1736543 RepID=UPI0006F2D8D3|nr:RuBisCO large subunit C-terminal-like domain-containing protein [Rhizobium sp. Root482]KQY14056.1 transcriptional regulator [Rhizobium sp. Root482]